MKRPLERNSENQSASKRARTDKSQEELNSSLLTAANNGDEESVISLLEDGADANAQNPRGVSVLHHCVKNNLQRAAQILIDNGANLHATTLGLLTPLHYATIYMQTNMVRLLIENGANVNLKDFCGHTPLHIGLGTFYQIHNDEAIKTITKILLEAKTDISLIDDEGKSTLSLMQKRAVLAPLLIEHYHQLLSFPKMRSLKDIMSAKLSQLAANQDIFQGQPADSILPAELIEHVTSVTPLMESKRAIIRNNLNAYQSSESFQESYKTTMKSAEKVIP